LVNNGLKKLHKKTLNKTLEPNYKGGSHTVEALCFCPLAALPAQVHWV